MLDPGFWILDTRCWILDVSCNQKGMQKLNVDFRIMTYKGGPALSFAPVIASEAKQSLLSKGDIFRGGERLPRRPAPNKTESGNQFYLVQDSSQ